MVSIRAVADLDEYLGRYYAASRAEIPEAAGYPEAFASASSGRAAASVAPA